MYRAIPSITPLLIVSLPMLAGSAPGIKNFDQVDAHVYRGGQPTAEGLRYLSQLGVKTIIDLREAGDRSRDEEVAVTLSGMKYMNVPMTGLTPPTESQIAAILKVLEDNTAGPVFVHCQRGADRTGAVIGVYHIDHDQWTHERALEDAKAHHMSFFQFPRQNYIKTFKARTVVADAPRPASANATSRVNDSRVIAAQPAN